MANAKRLDDDACKELLRLARAALEAYLANGMRPSGWTDIPGLNAHCGAFVSLHRGRELRGCIGQISADRELFRVVQDCAVSAAADDTRFPPVEAAELPDLDIEISVLSPLHRVAAPEEITVGMHGILVTRGHRRGLLLPQVASQYGWNRETFLAHTCRKAGLPESAWKDPGTVIEVFEAQVFSELDAAPRPGKAAP